MTTCRMLAAALVWITTACGGTAQPTGGFCASCDVGCGPGESCITSNAVTGFDFAICTAACTTDADCGADARCGVALNSPGTARACLPIGASACRTKTPPAGWHCDFPPPSCADATTLERGFEDQSAYLCGTEYVTCPNGCQAGATAGAAARCL